jgi:hypothetical protein
MNTHRRGVIIVVNCRVGVRDAPNVAVIVSVGAGFVKSTVGVSVGNSRVGIGAWVGVATSVPPGRLMNVGGACVGVGARVGRTSAVGVGARWSRLGRTRRLIVPAQYIIAAPMMTIAIQPYPIC